MPRVRTIEHAGSVHAIVWDGSEAFDPGVTFVTPVHYPLQVGVMRHGAGVEVRPHIHRDHEYAVNTTQEFILVERGLVAITVYTKDWVELEQFHLSAGHFILFVCGGHSLVVLEESQLVEVKQGPYPGDAEAKVFRDGQPADIAAAPTTATTHSRDGESFS